MSQSDFQIDNVSRSLFRTENNEALQALASLSSGATEPTTTYAYQLWADTTSGLLKMRNAANSAWISKGALATTNWGFALLTGGTYTGDITMSSSMLIEAEGAAVASAATTNIWATDGNTVHVTGNTGITSFGTAPQAGAWMKVIFDSTPTLTQSANLNLNGGGGNIQIEAGDIAFVYADTTTQFDVVVIRKSGAAVVNTAVVYASNAEYVTGTETAKALSPAVARARNIVSGIAVAATSGTSIDFTAIPSWVKRITLNFTGLSSSGSSPYILQLGDSGGIENTGYLSSTSEITSGVVTTNFTTGIALLRSTAAALVGNGSLVFTLLDSATNTWSCFGILGTSDAARTFTISGSKSLTATLDRIRLTTLGGVETFDAGSVNITYE